MKEKKQFFIPKNYDKKFEFLPGISGLEHLVFIPVALLDYVIIKHTAFSISNKFTIICVSLGLPVVLIATHPVRENVSLYKHLIWKLKFFTRQRIFQYRKEGYVNVTHKTERPKETGVSEKINPRLDSLKRDRKWLIDNTRPKNDSVPKSISR